MDQRAVRNVPWDGGQWVSLIQATELKHKGNLIIYIQFILIENNSCSLSDSALLFRDHFSKMITTHAPSLFGLHLEYPLILLRGSGKGKRGCSSRYVYHFEVNKPCHCVDLTEPHAYAFLKACMALFWSSFPLLLVAPIIIFEYGWNWRCLSGACFKRCNWTSLAFSFVVALRVS